MPYSYHKEGDKYVVTKKDTGKVVGHTKGTKEALNKYLAALHLNANEGKMNTMKKSELKEMIQEIIKEVMSESVDYDTAVAYRITTSGNRDEVMAKVQGLLDNLTTGKSSKFPEVKVTIMASKGNPNDIILKLNGPGAFSMSKDIKARPELKGVKISKYTPQLTKIS